MSTHISSTGKTLRKAGNISYIIGAAFLIAALAFNLLPPQLIQAKIGLSAAVDPAIVPGNPKCENYGFSGYKIDKAPNGTYDFITIYGSDGYFFSWSSTVSLDAVIVKGGDVANIFFYSPESFGDTGLYSPINPKNNKHYGISHIEFCYDTDPTPTEPTPTDPTPTDPTPTDPTPTDPTPTDPTPTDPTPTDPTPTDPTPTDPTPTDPTQTDPTPTDPTPTDPTPTDPTPTEPTVTEPTPTDPITTVTPTETTPEPTETQTTPPPTLAPPSNDTPNVLIPVTGIDLNGAGHQDNFLKLFGNLGFSLLGLGLVLKSLARWTE